MVLSAADLAAMQAASASLMDQPCTLWRKSPTPGGYGQPVDGFAQTATTVCSIAQPTAALMQNYDYLVGTLDTWLIRLPYGTNVLRDDQIIVGGVTMRVQVVLTPRSFPVHVRLLASAVR